MFLGAYHFDGEPSELVAAYERLMRDYPPETIDLHVCIRREAGITVFDACPSRRVFDEFSSGDDFRAAVAAAGLPAPRTEPLGEVHAVHLREALCR